MAECRTMLEARGGACTISELCSVFGVAPVRIEQLPALRRRDPDRGPRKLLDALQLDGEPRGLPSPAESR